VYFGRENLENVLKVSTVPFGYETGGPQSHSGWMLWRREKTLLLTGNRNMFFGSPALCLVTILTALLCLPVLNISWRKCCYRTEKGGAYCKIM